MEGWGRSPIAVTSVVAAVANICAAVTAAATAAARHCVGAA